MPLNFTLEETATASKARAGTFQTLHGQVQTRVFMPVYPQAAVKAQTVETLKMAGSRVLLANTYHLRHGAPHKLLKRGGWSHSSGLFRGELHEGNFLETFQGAVAPDLISYHPFSDKTDARLWTSVAFSRLLENISTKPTEFYTYSSPTAVRVALLTAGFFVAEGIGMGPKSSTTIAFTRARAAAEHPLKRSLLGHDWLGRSRRSDSKVPAGLAHEEVPAFERRIESHPQFTANSTWEDASGEPTCPRRRENPTSR
jgi:hypothetical protein